MSFNKNLKNLKSLEITIPKKNISSFKKLIKLYEAKFFSSKIVYDIRVARKLAVKLSGRGKAQQQAIDEIDQLWNLYLESLKPKPKPEAVSVVKISRTDNTDYVVHTHTRQLKYMMKAIPNALYMQTVKYYNASGELIQCRYFYT